MFRQTMEFILGDENSFKLESRFFHFYCLLGLVVSLLFAIAIKVWNFPVIAEISMFGFSIFVLLCWYLSRFCRFFNLSTFMAVTVLVFVLTPGLWVLNSGSSGGAQYFFIFWGVLICSIYKSWRRYVWLALLFITIGLLMYVEYTYPNVIFTYATREVRYFDVYSSMILAMLSTTIAFIIYSNSYHAEQEHVKQYAQTMERIANTDGLTGLYNQTYMMSRLETEIKLAEYSNSKLSLIMIDSDRFKNLNDTYGHPAGNTVLVQFADVLRANIRSSDIAGRCGGDEFLVICPETTLEDTIYITERLRNVVETLKFGYNDQITITISCGIATWAGENCRKFIEEVDQALYTAKRSGRNRVEIYHNDINAESV